MKKSSTSILVFGVYLLGMGLGLTLVPNVVIGTLGFPATDEIWIRVLGVVTLALAFYYISAARADLKTFAQWTVPARIGSSSRSPRSWWQALSVPSWLCLAQ